MVQGTGGTGSARLAAVAERWGLVGLYAFTAAAVVGYGVFGQDPGRLVGLPQWAARFYAWSFSFFALGHVWLAMLVLAAVLWLRAGGRWLGVFVLAYAVSLGSELAGTTWGIPFGEYGYSELLAPMWLERVPVVIPMSWFFMALPSYALAALAVRSPWARIVTGSVILLAWDLALDPAMSYATRYWVWGESGPYYGMPWLNLLGWYVTGLVLMGVFAWRRSESWTSGVSPRWWAGFYGANLLMPLGMCAAAGLWLAVGATLGVLGALALVMVPGLLRHSGPSGVTELAAGGAHVRS
ncbi:MAG TPA: carotenoid biosynthesis protein [Longimicrobiales bacterium]|nr:carotenoid biosynthesis protein [Longimicrobiales bacterium]